MYGLEPGSPISWEQVKSAIHEEDQPWAKSNRQAAIAEKRGYGFNFRIRRVDGVVRFVEGKTTPVFDAVGERIGFFGVTQDITERNRAEKALKDSESRFQSFAKIGSDWLWEMDADLRFSYLSEPIHRVTRLPREHYLGKTRAEASQGITDDEEWRRHLAELAAHRPFRDFCYTIVDADGNTRHSSISGTPIFAANGKFEGYRGVGSDITERKQAEAAISAAMEEAKIANRTKSEFLANMSHELRTPLNAIIGFSEIIKDQTFGPNEGTKYRDYAGDIHGAGKHLLDLINDLLDVSKIETGADDLQEESIDILDHSAETSSRRSPA